MRKFDIRPEHAGDEAAITRVTEAAFRTVAHSDQTEAFIVLALRRAGALTISLVAEFEGCVVGHVAFSPVRIADGASDWFGLGPVAVLPEFQNQGVGTALIHRGLAELRARAAAGCVVLGEPSYYGRFGFQSGSERFLAGVPSAYFQSLALDSRRATGEVHYHPAFEVRAPAP